MKYSKSKLVLSVCFIALLAFTGMPFVAAQGAVSEDFTTTTYEDSIATTAEGWGTGSVSNPRDYTITQLDFVQTSSDGGVRALDIQGRKVYVSLYKTGTGTNALRVYNISDPADIQFMGGAHPNTLLSAAAIDGDIMAVGNEGSWLKLYNVSDPTAIPSSIWSYDFSSGSVTDIEFQGHYMYVAVYGQSGIEDFNIYDIENPACPSRTDYAGFSQLRGIEVLGQIAYLAVGTYGLHVNNISDPYDENQLDWVNTPGFSTDCLVDGDICYVADGTAGVQVVDCSNPTNSVIIGTYNTPDNATQLALQGNTLFVADKTSVQVLDVSNPATPVYVDAITLADVRDIGLSGGVLVIGTDAGLYTYSVGSVVTDFPLIGSYSSFDAKDVVCQGDVAYVAAGADGLVALDVSNPASPTLLDRAWEGATIDYMSLDVEGEFAYVINRGSSYKGLHCFNITDPTNVIYCSYLSFTYPWDVDVSGDVAFVADGEWGLYISNVTDPYGMDHGYWFDEMENTTAVTTQGHFVYTVGNGSTSYEFGQHNININDHSNPILADVIQWTDAEDIVVSGDYAYIANGYSGVNIGDITDPWNIINSAYNPLPGTTYCTAIEVFGNYVFIGERWFGLRCIDASDIEELTILNSYTAGSLDVRSLTISGDYLYAACGNQLLIFRIFRSAGDTYQDECLAQSLTFDTTPFPIVEATLTATTSEPAGTSIAWYISADGGVNWASVPLGVAWPFINVGSDLRWRAIISNPNDGETASISSVSITYVDIPPPNLLPVVIAVIAVIIIILVLLLLYFLWFKKKK